MFGDQEAFDFEDGTDIETKCGQLNIEREAYDHLDAIGKARTLFVGQAHLLAGHVQVDVDGAVISGFLAYSITL